MRYRDVFLSRKGEAVFSPAAQHAAICKCWFANRLQGADSFWLRTSIYFCLSLSHRLFLFLLLSPHAFLFPSIFSFFYQTLFQSTSLIFPSPSCKRKLSSADKEYCSCEPWCLEKRMGLRRRECTEHGVTDGMQVAYWSGPKTHQVFPRNCPMDSAAWTSVYSTSLHPLTDESIPSFWRPKMQSNTPWCVLIRCVFVLLLTDWPWIDPSIGSPQHIPWHQTFS